jgi:putative acetyltransferase
MSVIIELGDPCSSQVIAMMRESDAYYASLYPSESNHLLDAKALTHENAYFFTATSIDKIVGFGALVARNDYAEIKRMYVSPLTRGMGIGCKLLIAIEQQARDLKLRVLRLETGIKQLEALRLYKTAGYRDIAPFGDYKLDPLSVYMEKSFN